MKEQKKADLRGFLMDLLPSEKLFDGNFRVEFNELRAELPSTVVAASDWRYESWRELTIDTAIKVLRAIAEGKRPDASDLALLQSMLKSGETGDPVDLVSKPLGTNPLESEDILHNAIWKLIRYLDMETSFRQRPSVSICRQCDRLYIRDGRGKFGNGGYLCSPECRSERKKNARKEAGYEYGKNDPRPIE